MNHNFFYLFSLKNTLAFFLVYLIFAGIHAQTIFPSVNSSTGETNFFSMTILTKDLHYPWSVESIPCRSSQKTCPLQLIITEKRTGRIFLWEKKKLIELANIKRFLPFVAIGQGGLLDIALSPDFLDDKKVYFTYSGFHRQEKNNTRRYATFLAEAHFEVRDKRIWKIKNIFTSKTVSANNYHFGSRIVFDEKGHLYFSIGDRGQRHESQSLKSHCGKILRINKDGSVPLDNPFVKTRDALPEIYTYGHRNPQGMAQINGKIWIHEHGPKGGDEINLLQPGSNYGWPLVSHGVHYTGRKVGTGKSHLKGVSPPLHQWTPSIAPCGMLFYRGTRIPFWNESMFIGALAGRQVRRLTWKNLSTKPILLEEEILLKSHNFRIRDVTQSPDGRIYIITDSSEGMLLELDIADQ